MKRLSPEKLLENLNVFYEYIKKYIPGNRGDMLLDFYKQIELTLSTAPASTRLDHHNCFIGGYVDHVNRVVEVALVLDRVWDKFKQQKNYTLEELVFSAINHDLGKVGTDKAPVYIQNDSQWHIEKLGIHFKYNPNITHLRIADRSLYCLQSAGIQMSETEYLAIKLHDGLYEESNKQYYMNFGKDTEIKSNLIFILHQADFLASRVETQI